VPIAEASRARDKSNFLMGIIRAGAAASNSESGRKQRGASRFFPTGHVNSCGAGGILLTAGRTAG
jgi:hypothetical protein